MSSVWKIRVMNTLLRSSYGNTQLTARDILVDPGLLLAFGFGSGLSRFMPGTMGTLAAIPVYYLLINAIPLQAYWLVCGVGFLLGIWLCGYATRKLAVHDFGGIVWDEVIGLLITLAGFAYSWQVLLSGFVLFRILDIFKPWPIRYADQKIHGGLGIMLDDVLAGILANLLLHLVF